MEPGKISEKRIAEAVDLVRRYLTQHNDLKRTDEARRIIKALLQAGAEAEIDEVYLMIEDWRHHNDNRRNTIFDARNLARKVVKDHPDHYRAHWLHAYALKYSGDYIESDTEYDRAIHLAVHPENILSVTADKAEMYVYWNRSQAAIEMLEALGDLTVSWHRWVHAFALHQSAHNQADKEDKRSRYEQSNALLETVTDEGSDPQLIVAANWAALARLPGAAKSQVDSAESAFETAIQAFLAGVPNGWSVHREKRGTFIKSNNRDKQYARHFLDNIGWKGILPNRGADGDPVTDPET